MVTHKPKPWTWNDAKVWAAQTFHTHLSAACLMRDYPDHHTFIDLYGKVQCLSVEFAEFCRMIEIKDPCT